MNSVGEQKDLLTWWKEDLTPAVITIRRTLEGYMEKWQGFCIALNQAFNTFIQEHKETLELWASFANIYPQLRPYIENITHGLEDPDFEIANDVIEMAHVFQAIDVEKAPESVSLMSIITSEPFQKSIIELYSSLHLNQVRLILIQEALLLHNLGYYGGSICLLYGLIEGVLTESFEKSNYIVINSNQINPIGIDGTLNTKQNLTGLVSKLDHAIGKKDRLQEYYAKIKTYELVNGNPEQTIPRTRNQILHGRTVDFNTERRSAQLILWLYSTLIHIQVLGIDCSGVADD